MTDTIYALSSGAGIAAVAVIRVSGPGAGRLLDDISGPRPRPRQASLRFIKDPTSMEVLDKGLVLWFPGPNSATAEDLCEFHVHGSPAVVEALFSLFRRYQGVRPAEPGEFTRRAFANGKLDLVEIEGLADLLKARTESQRRLAVHHLVGNASAIYDQWRLELVGILARVESALDFSDQEDIVEGALQGLSIKTESLVRSMLEALRMANRARSIRNGVKVVLAGPPNTGKSSLLNTIAKRDAAIVSSYPGTTRDVIEIMIDLDGLPILLTDTAGIRAGTGSEIERMGIAKTEGLLRSDHIVIWVGSPDIPNSSLPIDGVCPDIFVLNKADLLPRESGLTRNDSHLVSTLTGDGIAAVLDALTRLIRDKYGQSEQAVVVRARQRQAIEDSIRFLNSSLQHGSGAVELVAEDLRSAGHCLARVTGRIDVEDLLTSIFSEFCLGK